MFWTRTELKQRAKNTLHLSYWKCVLVAVILSIAGGGGSGVNFNYNFNTDDFSNDFSNVGRMTDQLTAMIAVIMAVVAIASVIGVLISVFLFGPLDTGCRRFFIIARVQPADLGEMGHSFEHNYMNVVKVMFLRGLYTFLWSLLFLIPGIIKAYEYRMIPYILAEDPSVSSADAFRLSKQMMDGEKANAFVLDLSFIGWYLLSLCTIGLLGVFYVNPYYHNTCTELYSVLKQKVTAPQPQPVMYGNYSQPGTQNGYSQPGTQNGYSQPGTQNGYSQPENPQPEKPQPEKPSDDAPFNTPYGQ